VYFGRSIRILRKKAGKPSTGKIRISRSTWRPRPITGEVTPLIMDDHSLGHKLGSLCLFQEVPSRIIWRSLLGSTYKEGVRCFHGTVEPFRASP
jgi:hypothetical protein